MQKESSCKWTKFVNIGIGNVKKSQNRQKNEKTFHQNKENQFNQFSLKSLHSNPSRHLPAQS